MLLKVAKVGPFKSINTPQTVEIDPKVTVLVGMNEAGKTVFLQALEKADDVLDLAAFSPVDDYPRKDLTSYLKRHSTNPDTAIVLTYGLTDAELLELNTTHHTKLNSSFLCSVTTLYSNGISVGLTVDEKPVIEYLLRESAISSDAKVALKKATSLRAMPELLKDINLTDDDEVFLKTINARIAKTKWHSIPQWEVWEWLKPRVPKFLYFSDYDLLPSKTNLIDLAQRVEQDTTGHKRLSPEYRAVLALLRMADISITDFTKPGGYELLKAKIEGVSISLTDQIMEFWKQNEELEVEIDIKPDPEDDAPYNTGPNLYLRIKNRRHRGVSTPFQQRSRGFIWFFSFLVWFDSVQHQITTAGKAPKFDLILLLDEPGLALHALAQSDFLRYIDSLAERHQVLYTTHSPFMIHSDRLNQVRVVEDKDTVGTVISGNISDSNSRTIFPLQAALGWTIAQNLFISTRNLLVEGPSDLIFLKFVSTILETKSKIGLRDDITIVPVGGLDKVVTFVALLGANDLELAVLHDFRGSPEQKLVDLVRQKLLSPKALMNASQFRDLTKIGSNGPPTDIEDLFSPTFYLDLFNKTFTKELGGVTINETDLPAGDRIIGRIEEYLASKNIQIRPSGGFNHYRVSSYLASNPPKTLDADSLKRFEAIFTTVNSLF